MSVIAELSDRVVAPANLGSVEIALAEALNNVVEHAYGPDERGDIELNCFLEGSGLTIQIVDHGGLLPDGKVPEGRAANLSVPRKDLPEGGFGWFLIHELTTSLSYERSAECNRLNLFFDLADKPV